MNLTIPFKKEIPFKSKIAEITSISLEHDVSINDSEILGDFIVSGDYKNLDVNVDTMPFSHVVPFSVTLDENIDLDTLSYEISAFDYEIINDDILKVNITFHVEAEKLKREDESIFMDVTDELLDQDNLITKDVEEDGDSSENIDDEAIIATLDVENSETDDDREDNEVEASVITQNDLEQDYITYHVHIAKINETIDSLCTLYKIDKDELLELNDITDLNIGDKVIIPVNKEDE